MIRLVSTEISYLQSYLLGCRMLTWCQDETFNKPQDRTGCSSKLHLSGTTSIEGPRSPEDTRLPGYKSALSNARQPETSTFKSENSPLDEDLTFRTNLPRQSQYAFNNIDLAARDSRPMQSFYPEPSRSPLSLHGILSAGGSWNNEADFSMGFDPLVNNGVYGNGFDTEMSDQQNNSTGLTPQSSLSYNNSSSNTSYSPPNMQDEDATTTQAKANSPIPGGMTGFTPFSPPSNNVYSGQGSGGGGGSGNVGTTMSPSLANNQAFASNRQPLSGPGQDDPFKNMSWDMGSGGTPGTMSGMTPGREWEKMMDSMGQAMGWGTTPGSEKNR